MIERDLKFYDLLGASGVGFDNRKFQEFIDRFQEKYNAPQTDGFDWDDEIQIDFTYQQLQEELGIATLPTFVDVDSPAPYKGFDNVVIGSNKIPRFKHGFAMNEKIIREQMVLAQRYGSLSATAKSQLMKLLFDSVDKLIMGNQNELVFQRNQIVSTGEFNITAENNPQGIKGVTFNFGINKDSLKTTARWWTSATHTVENQGSTSDPIADLKAWRKAASKKGVPLGQFEISQTLWDDMLGHTKVLEKVGYASISYQADATIAINYAQNMTDDAVRRVIESIVGAPIKVRDVKSVVDKYSAETKRLEKVAIDAFDPKNIAYVPQGMLGTIKAVEPIAVPDPAARIAYFDGGRTIIKNTFNTSTNTQYVESECTALVVPSVSKYMYVYTVTA